MKHVIVLLTLLSIPSFASAQHKISEEWTTYCDGAIEKVRVSFTYDLAAIGFEDTHSEWAGAYRAPCAEGCDGTVREGTLVDLGSDHYRWTWEGWTRECLTGPVWRFAMMSYIAYGEFGPENRLFFVDCEDGPQSIIDTADCTTLPVTASTWGAIKALYR